MRNIYNPTSTRSRSQFWLHHPERRRWPRPLPPDRALLSLVRAQRAAHHGPQDWDGGADGPEVSGRGRGAHDQLHQSHARWEYHRKGRVWACEISIVIQGLSDDESHETQFIIDPKSNTFKEQYSACGYKLELHKYQLQHIQNRHHHWDIFLMPFYNSSL